MRPRSRPRSTLLAAPLACAALLAANPAAAAPLVFEGDVPADGPDHFFVEVEVPPGTAEIEVRHDDLSEVNILDFGLDDALAGGAGYRGWGGGTTEPIVVNETAASRAYVPGPIRPGTWRVVVGKAKVVASPARYRIEVELRSTPTLAAERPRTPYAPPPVRKTETRYYAGDLHVHSRESTDASATLEENVALAKQRGLEWLEISDHNTVTQLDYFGGVHDEEPGFLLVPGIEYTTYAGHANAIGATRFVDHKIGQPGVTIESAADAIRAQGAILSINHPVLDIGDLCIGCAWQHDLDPTKIGGVEIGTLGVTAGAQLFSERAIAFWDALLDRGAKIPALGGSDDHRAGTSTGIFPAKVGSPTTLVRATELSTRGILDGIKRGATVVKLDGPDDAMVELEAVPRRDDVEGLAFPGDTIGVRSILLRAKVTNGVGQTVRFVKNGTPEDSVVVTADPFVHYARVDAPAEGEDRWRAEALVDERPRTVTSHLWLRRDPAGPDAEAAASDEGCGVAREGGARAPWVGLALAGLVAALRRRRRAL